MTFFQKIWNNLTASPASDLDPKKERAFITGKYQWIENQRVEAGEQILQAKIDTTLSKNLEAICMLYGDIDFAADCFEEAFQHGIPDVSNLYSKAFIHAGIVAYARAFVSGVRQTKLDENFFSEMRDPNFDTEIHEHLMSLRNKHIAHSVNEFDYCRIAAIVLGTHERGWRDGKGLAFNQLHTIGISGAMLEKAISQAKAVRAFLSKHIENSCAAVHQEFAAKFAETGTFEMAPIGYIPDRTKVAKRRPDDR